MIAAKLVAEGVDFEQVRPMIATAERGLQSAVLKAGRGSCGPTPGYRSNGQIDSLRERGITT